MKVLDDEPGLLEEVDRTAEELHRNQQQMANIRSQLPGLAWQMGRERAILALEELVDLAPRFLEMQDSMIALLDTKASAQPISDTCRQTVMSFVRLLEASRREVMLLIRGLRDALSQEIH